MELVVFKYNNKTALENRLNALALSYRTGTNEYGDDYRIEEYLGRVSTPHLVDINGDKYFASLLSTEDANKMPNNDHNPAFTIIWRSSEYDTTDPENPVHYPWPQVEVQTYNEAGEPDGTRMQGVGKIQ